MESDEISGGVKTEGGSQNNDDSKEKRQSLIFKDRTPIFEDKTSMNEELIYATLGEEGFTRLTSKFYEKMKEDNLVGPMYPDNDWEGSEERLRDFLLFFCIRGPELLVLPGVQLCELACPIFSPGQVWSVLRVAASASAPCAVCIPPVSWRPKSVQPKFRIGVIVLLIFSSTEVLTC